MEPTKSLSQLRRARLLAVLTLNWDEVTRLDGIIEKREADRNPPLHTNHHKKPDVQTIKQHGHLNK